MFSDFCRIFFFILTTPFNVFPQDKCFQYFVFHLLLELDNTPRVAAGFVVHLELSICRNDLEASWNCQNWEESAEILFTKIDAYACIGQIWNNISKRSDG